MRGPAATRRTERTGWSSPRTARWPTSGTRPRSAATSWWCSGSGQHRGVGTVPRRERAGCELQRSEGDRVAAAETGVGLRGELDLTGDAARGLGELERRRDAVRVGTRAGRHPDRSGGDLDGLTGARVGGGQGGKTAAPGAAVVARRRGERDHGGGRRGRQREHGADGTRGARHQRQASSAPGVARGDRHDGWNSFRLNSADSLDRYQPADLRAGPGMSGAVKR